MALRAQSRLLTLLLLLYGCYSFNDTDIHDVEERFFGSRSVTFAAGPLSITFGGKPGFWGLIPSIGWNSIAGQIPEPVPEVGPRFLFDICDWVMGLFIPKTPMKVAFGSIPRVPQPGRLPVYQGPQMPSRVPIIPQGQGMQPAQGQWVKIPGQNRLTWMPSQGTTFPGQRPQLLGQRPQLPGQRPQFPGQRPQFPGQGQQLPGQRPQFPGQGQQLPGQRPQFPDQGQQLPGQRPQFPGQGQQFPGQRQQFPGQGSQLPGQGPAIPSQGPSMMKPGAQGTGATGPWVQNPGSSIPSTQETGTFGRSDKESQVPGKASSPSSPIVVNVNVQQIGPSSPVVIDPSKTDESQSNTLMDSALASLVKPPEEVLPPKDCSLCNEIVAVFPNQATTLQVVEYLVSDKHTLDVLRKFINSQYYFLPYKTGKFSSFVTFLEFLDWYVKVVVAQETVKADKELMTALTSLQLLIPKPNAIGPLM